MNIVKTIAARERGFKRIQGYDVSLLRLKCFEEDVFAGVEGSISLLDGIRPPVFACNFSTAPGYEQVIAFANEDGIVALQDTEEKRNSNDPLEGTQAHNNAVFDVAWMPKELKLITASGDRTACLWDVSLSRELVEIQSFKGHTHTIKSAVFRHEDKAVFATGSRDGAIMIWDIRANHNGLPKPDNTIFGAHKVKVPSISTKQSSSKKSQQNSVMQSVTSLVFQDDYNLLSCSAGDGMIKVWDLRKNYTVHKKESVAKHILKYGGKSNTYNGFTSLLINPYRTILYASCVDGKIYSYNLSSYSPNPIAEYYGHLSSNKTLSFYVKACLSPDGEYLISGSNDETAYIWRTKNPGIPFMKLCGHRDEVICTAWCSIGDTKIVTCTEDCYHRIWRVRPDVDNMENNELFGYAERYVSLDSTETPKPTTLTTPQSIKNQVHALFDTPTSCVSSTGSNCASSSGKKTLSPIQEKNELSPRKSNDGRAARKLYFSPLDKHSKDQEHKSPIKISNDTSVAVVFSPTTGLPNFVIDGTAPHLSNSPQKSKENVDWLTKIRKRKRAETEQDSPSNDQTKKTPSSRGKKTKRLSSDKTRTSKSQRCLMPAITNFCTHSFKEKTE